MSASDGAAQRPWRLLARRRWRAMLAADGARLAQALAAGTPSPPSLSSVQAQVRRAIARAEPALLRTAIVDSLAAVVTAVQARRPQPVPAAVLQAALALRHGAAVELAAMSDRRLATALAAASAALGGGHVHVMAATDDDAGVAASEVAPVFQACGLGCAVLSLDMDPATLTEAYRSPVVYASVRRLAGDITRDTQTRLQLGADGPVPHLVPGVRQAFVEPLDRVLADDALGPLVLSVPDDPSRLADALAAACRFVDGLVPGADHDGHQLRDSGLRKLADDLPGWPAAWRGRDRPQTLVRQALYVRDGLIEGRDYALLGPADHCQLWLDDSVNERLPQRDLAAHLPQAVQLRLGLPMSPITRTVGRTTVAAFVRQYRQLGGCAPCLDGLDAELWRSHGLLRCAPVPLPATPCTTVAVADAAAWELALGDAVTAGPAAEGRGRDAAGESMPVIAGMADGTADATLARLVVLRRAGDAPRLQALVPHPRAAWALEALGPHAALQALAAQGPVHRVRIVFAEPADHRRAERAWLLRAADALPGHAPPPEAVRLIAADSRWLAQRLPIAARVAGLACRAWPGAARWLLPPLVVFAQALTARHARAHRLAMPDRERQLRRQLSFTAAGPATDPGRSP